MKNIVLSFDLFRDLTYREDDEAILMACLNLTVMRNEQWLHRHPETPLLYESGVYYQLEPNGEEEFASIPKVLRMGSGDCDDLVCWLTAERRVRFNDNASVLLVGTEIEPGYIQYHVMVRHGDGTVEDPSAVLGMSDTPETIRDDVASLYSVHYGVR